MAYFLIRPLRFTDEAVREDWKNKMSPPRFLLQSYLLLLVAILASPFGALSGDSLLTPIQKAFEECMQVTSISLAFFAGCFVAHLILNQARMRFIRAFYLFCYLQGFLWILGGIILIALCVAVGKYMKVGWDLPFITFSDEIHRRRAGVVSLIALLLVVAMDGYVWASVVRAYRPRWYRFVVAFLAFLFSTAVVSYMLGHCVGYISARLLSNE